MILEHFSKNKKVLLILSLIVLAVGAFIALNSPVIFQEGNPWPQIKGIAQLTFSDKEIVKLDIGENKYITKSNSSEIIKSLMKERGYDFTEQMESGYLFKSQTGASAVATHRYYSRYYSLWTISENGNNDDNLWTTTTNDDGITYRYPKELSVKYISAAEWPPTVKIESGNFSCIQTPQEKSSMLDISSQRIVDGRIYCISIKNEGAAGSVYSSYTYTTPRRGMLVSISFALRYPNCTNYDEKQGQDCASERESFDLDTTVDRIAQTVSWSSSSSEDTLADQIAKCLTSSYSEDMERCGELSKQITDFDSCVIAGFSILKSDPAQCQTIDGKTFIQETNSTWEQALSAISNCEIEKAFQTHSKIVTLTLKNGNKLIAKEPQIDDIIYIIKAAESKCGKVPIGTE